MLKKIKLVGIFLAIPVICFFALGSASSDQEQSWNRELRKSLPAERVPEFALPMACYDTALRQSFDLTLSVRPTPILLHSEHCHSRQRQQLFCLLV